MRLSFFLSEAFDSLRRNWVMTMASVLTVVVTMAILGVVLVTDKNLKEGTTSLTNRVEIEVFIKGAPPQQSSIDALNTTIAGLKQRGVVKNYTYISQAQALADLEQMLGPDSSRSSAIFRATRCRPRTRSSSRTPTRSIRSPVCSSPIPTSTTIPAPPTA